jgi:Transposase zinc-ribbon domain
MVGDVGKPGYQEMNLLLFQEEFKNEEQCQGWLVGTRWPKGFCCPACRHGKYSLITTRKLFKCLKCSYQAFHRLLRACVSTTTVTRNELMSANGELCQ